MTQNKDALQIFDNGKTVWDNNYQFTTAQINQIREALQLQSNAGAVDVDKIATKIMDLHLGKPNDYQFGDGVCKTLEYLDQNNHLKTSDTIVIDRADVPEGLDNAVSSLMNGTAEKYPLGTDFGRYESDIRIILEAAALIAAEME